MAGSIYAYGPPPPRLASTVGPVTLVEGQTFCISGQTGDVSPYFPQGLFVYDTRVVSGFELRVNGYVLKPFTAETLKDRIASVCAAHALATAAAEPVVDASDVSAQPEPASQAA